MKFIWDVADLPLNVGTVVRHRGKGEPWIIGYVVSATMTGARWCLISLRDGMIGQPHKAEAFVKVLENYPPIMKRVLLEDLLT